MIVYNSTSDRFELYSPAALAYGTQPKYLRGLFRTQWAAWVALTHVQGVRA